MTDDYIVLPEDQASERIALLCYLSEQYRTDYDPTEARRLGLGQSAYCYRNLDEKALVAFEDSFSETRAAKLRRLRNQRYYQRRRVKETQQAS